MLVALIFLVAILVVVIDLLGDGTRGRKLLSDNDITGLFSDAEIDADIVIVLWTEIADCMRVKKGRLRPHDMLAELEPAGSALHTPYYDELISFADARARRHGRSVNIEDVQTVRDYILTFYEDVNSGKSRSC